MFILRKILDSGVNVPEVVRVKANASLSYKAGTALVLSSGVAANPTATEKPTHICAEEVGAGKQATMLVYPILPGMIFECAISAAPASVVPGNKLTLSLDSDSRATGVTATVTSGVATVVDLCGAKSAGDKILIQF